MWEFRRLDDLRRFRSREERAATHHKSRYLVHFLSPQPVIWLRNSRAHSIRASGRSEAA
jgi:hypothetical protein